MLSKLMYELYRIKWNYSIGLVKDFIKSLQKIYFQFKGFFLKFVKYEIYDWGKGEEYILLLGEQDFIQF